jgi:ethanolamine permease
MTEAPEVGSRPKLSQVQYENVSVEYFEQRSLKRHARVGSLWAMGVGAVISGDFFGWNFGLAAGGFGGMLAATLIATAMYVGLCFSIAELSAALPHTGGAYSFARAAFGPWGGYLTGLAENMEYVLTAAVIVVGIGGYLGSLFGTSSDLAPLWWFATYGFFLWLNVRGVALTFRFAVGITLLALGVLAVFYITGFRYTALQHCFDIPSEGGNPSWLPFGPLGVLKALPFAIWFYLAIEQLPLAAEESYDPVRDIPKGLLWGLGTLVLCAFATLIINTCLPPGANLLARSEEPLFDGFRAIFGNGLGSRVLAAVALSGLIASFHGVLFAYGRQIYSLSRAGYFPRVLSLTHPRHKTPHLALFAGSAVGFGAAMGIHLLGPKSPVGAVLLNMTVFGAVLSYVLQMASYVALRLRWPHLERPYRSPLKVFGAVAALLLSVLTLVTLFIGGSDYVNVALAATLWFVLGVIYFAVFARHRLVLAPEEEFARGVRASEDKPPSEL